MKIFREIKEITIQYILKALNFYSVSNPLCHQNKNSRKERKNLTKINFIYTTNL